MANISIGLMFMLFVVFISTINCHLMNGVNGGAECAGCAMVLGIIERVSIIYNESIVLALERFCNFLPNEFRIYCKVAVDVLSPIIIDGFSKNETSDVICHSLKICRTDPGQPECRLYQLGSSSSSASLVKSGTILRENHPSLLSLLTSDICNIPGIAEICKIIERAFKSRLPAIDIDGDRFGTEPTLRGTSWRGKDCDDFSSKIRPGARSVMGDYDVDHNCNGIVCMDSSTGRPWEQELCNDTQRMGIAILGDSISAHFHIPEQWVDASQASSYVFEHMPFIIENELDWPHLSSSTGYVNISWPNIKGPTRSSYARFFERDHCNHRDYQNIAVNGARSSSMINISKTLMRDPQNDVPLFVFYALVGNDVCNGHQDTISHMTTVEEMRANLLTVLKYLDTVLPKGSHVLTTGLGNGSLLYQILHDRIHPLGRAGTPVTYAQFYSYLSCLQISPCNGWLTTNDTLRAFTSQRAVDLSEAIRNITLSYSSSNYDLYYMDFPYNDVYAEWAAQGGQPWQLIEPVDGFHMNQYGHAIVSDVTWSWLEKHKPSWLPPINPNNAEIERIFKDQGGY